MCRTSPLWEGGNITTEGGVVKFVDKDSEEGSSLFIWVLLELRVNLENECGSHSGK